jgi:hypothetical protein
MSTNFSESPKYEMSQKTPSGRSRAFPERQTDAQTLQD